MSYYQNPRMPGFYGDLSATGTSGIPMSAYDPYAVNAVPPLQIPTGAGMLGSGLPTQHRASSGAWNQEDDAMLLRLRASGKNWNQIMRDAFPNKTGNACRKRHERLMERRGQNDFDNRKLERLCKEYMSMRKELWQPLATACGEKWSIVEAQATTTTKTKKTTTTIPGGAIHPATTAAALGCLTPVDELAGGPDGLPGSHHSYSSPETGGAHSTPGGSSGSGVAACRGDGGGSKAAECGGYGD
ncbi:hypothetical protein N0V88_005512 [Collariella sp. IMI 366227]|nr:hypothetical protein N0V88_005512 [Collariella sp. IMI 366227]